MAALVVNSYYIKMKQTPAPTLNTDVLSEFVLVANNRQANILTSDGELITITKGQTNWQALYNKPILCNAKVIKRYLEIPDFPAFDLSSLFLDP